MSEWRKDGSQFLADVGILMKAQYKTPDQNANGATIVGVSSTTMLVARPINCDQVELMLNSIDRYLPPMQHPQVSRAREMQKYALLYELMEVANLYFKDSNAQHNGTPGDVRRFQYASKAEEAESYSNSLNKAP